MKLINQQTLKQKHVVFNGKNKKNSKFLLYVLCGYKDYLYDELFTRIKAFVPDYFDICICSSGIYDSRLEEIAKENNYVYIHTLKNDISILQNIVINYYKKAEYVYKMDEDIFLTKNCLSEMLKTYLSASTKDKVLFSAPLLLINGYASIKILELLNLKEKVEQKFNATLKYSVGKPTTLPEFNPDFVKYMWNINNDFYNLDELNHMMSKNEFSYSYCPIKFSIGLILFERKTWVSMGFFNNFPLNSSMGFDEYQLYQYSKRKRFKIAISNNSVVGHLSFGYVNAVMKAEYLKNPDHFKIQDY